MPNMQHERYGVRHVEEEQVTSYKRTGWSATDEQVVVPDVLGDELVARTVTQVLAEVGDDPELAQRALAAEQAHEAPRKSLVTALERTAAGSTEQEA